MIHSVIVSFVLLCGLVFRFSIFTSIYSGDVNNHVGWGQSILKFGFSGSYERSYVGILQPTYPPFALFAFTTGVGIFDLAQSVSINLNASLPFFPSQLIWWFEDQDTLPAFTKIFSIVTDIGVGLLLYVFCRKSGNSFKLSLLVLCAYIFNPAVWYLSALWGQIESIPIFFLLLSIFLLSKSRPHLAAISLAAMILSKQTSIIFLPLVAILYLRHCSLQKIISSFFVAVVTFWLSYLPFMTTLNLTFPLDIYIYRLQTGSGSTWITDHAFNLWALFTRLEKISDTTPIFANVPAVTLGYVVFLIFSAYILFSYLKRRTTFWLCASSLSVGSFMLLTKMHERYLAPAIPFFLIVCASHPRLWPAFIFLSLGHLINVYHDWFFPRIPGLDVIISMWSIIVLVIVTFSVILAIHLILVAKRQHS